MVELSKKGNTKVLKRNGITEVWLYNTAIVVFDANSITLNHGGWKTATTKQRMNQASDEYDLGYQVYQDNYNWYVNFKGNAYKFETCSLTLNRA